MEHAVYRAKECSGDCQLWQFDVQSAVNTTYAGRIAG